MVVVDEALLLDRGRVLLPSSIEMILQRVFRAELTGPFIIKNLSCDVYHSRISGIVAAMQDEVLKLVLLTLSEGALISRKTLVMYIVQTLRDDYPQVSKTCVGHVVQLLYRASCFNVSFTLFLFFI